MWSPLQLVYRTAFGCMVLEIFIHNVAQGKNVFFLLENEEQNILETCSKWPILAVIHGKVF
jgi:hypothetical protein